jgi:hypothetical protein
MVFSKTDAVALQKLEKTIRRDLGARTSYAKYFVSQGSQGNEVHALRVSYSRIIQGVCLAQPKEAFLAALGNKAKEQASNDAERLKKAKTDAVALQKLEKTIRRDLGNGMAMKFMPCAYPTPVSYKAYALHSPKRPSWLPCCST